MIGTLGPQPNARSVILPEPRALRLPSGDLQPLAPPDPLDPLVVDQPCGPAQQLGDLAIAVPAILMSQLDDVVPAPSSSYIVPISTGHQEYSGSMTLVCH